MIPEIGFMIGAYIITRMVDLISDTSGTHAGPFTKFLAAATIFVTVIMMIALMGTARA